MNKPETPDQLLAWHIGSGAALSPEQTAAIQQEFITPEQESATDATARHEESSTE